MSETLLLRETINALWFVVSLCATTVFVLYIARAMAEPKWYGRTPNQAAIALAVYFSGETLIRGWIWLTLQAQGAGWHDLLAGAHMTVIAVAASISMAGALCCIRVFSPSNRAWVISLVIAGSFALMAALI
jgi:hypothetical protein